MKEINTRKLDKIHIFSEKINYEIYHKIGKLGLSDITYDILNVHTPIDGIRHIINLQIVNSFY